MYLRLKLYFGQDYTTRFFRTILEKDLALLVLTPSLTQSSLSAFSFSNFCSFSTCKANADVSTAPRHRSRRQNSMNCLMIIVQVTFWKCTSMLVYIRNPTGNTTQSVHMSHGYQKAVTLETQLLIIILGIKEHRHLLAPCK